mgnify:CR=1 FL=1
MVLAYNKKLQFKNLSKKFYNQVEKSILSYNNTMKIGDKAFFLVFGKIAEL